MSGFCESCYCDWEGIGQAESKCECGAEKCGPECPCEQERRRRIRIGAVPTSRMWEDWYYSFMYPKGIR